MPTRREVVMSLTAVGALSVNVATSSGASPLSIGRNSSQVGGDAPFTITRCPHSDETTTDAQGRENSDHVEDERGDNLGVGVVSGNDPLIETTVTPDSVVDCPHIFELTNTDDRSHCLVLQLTGSGNPQVPTVPGPVPDEYDFSAGAPAVVFFYSTADGERKRIGVEPSDKLGVPLDPEESVCVGLTVRLFGISPGTTLFDEERLRVTATRRQPCRVEDQSPTQREGESGEERGDDSGEESD